MGQQVPHSPISMLYIWNNPSKYRGQEYALLNYSHRVHQSVCLHYNLKKNIITQRFGMKSFWKLFFFSHIANVIGHCHWTNQGEITEFVWQLWPAVLRVLSPRPLPSCQCRYHHLAHQNPSPRDEFSSLGRWRKMKAEIGCSDLSMEQITWDYLKHIEMANIERKH